MGKSNEKFMQMREEELLGLEHIQDEYTYKDWINNLKSPKVVATGKDGFGFDYVISGDSPKEVYELAKQHGITYNFNLLIPYKHIFNK